MSQSILVTGGAGYIGSHTCKLLSKRGYTPVVLDTLEKGHLDFVKWGPFVQGSVHDIDLVSKTIKHHQIKGVIHFAAYIEVAESVKNPFRYYRNNVLGTAALLGAMQMSKCRNLIFSSSAAVYEESLHPLSENSRPNPNNPYGYSKLFAEKIIQDFCSITQSKAIALRYFNACGADSEGDLGELHEPETHLIPKILQSITRKVDFKVFGTDYKTIDGSCVRDYIHVQDLAEAHLLSLERLMSSNEVDLFDIYNIGTGQGLSVFQIIEEVERQALSKLNYTKTQRRVGDPAQLVANVNKIKSELGFVAQHSSLKEIIESAWNWEKRFV